MKNNDNLSENAKKVLGIFDNYSILRKELVNKCREAGMKWGEYTKGINELKETGVISQYEVLPQMNSVVYDAIPVDYAVTLYVLNK